MEDGEVVLLSKTLGTQSHLGEEVWCSVLFVLLSCALHAFLVGAENLHLSHTEYVCLYEKSGPDCFLIRAASPVFSSGNQSKSVCLLLRAPNTAVIGSL